MTENKFEKLKRMGFDLKDSIIAIPKQYKRYIAGGLTALVLLGSVYAFSNANRAFAVEVNGKKIAIVENQKQAQEILKQTVADKAKEIGQKVEINDKISFKKIKAKNFDLDGVSSLKSKYNKSLTYVTTGTAIVANNEEKLVLLNKRSVDKTIEQLAQSYISTYKNIKINKVEYVDKVEYKDKKINIKDVVKESDAVTLLKQGRSKVVTYQVAQGESVWAIARKNDMYVKEIQDANPSLNVEKLKPGQEIKLSKVEPMLKIKIFARATTTETVAYSIKTVKDSSFTGTKVTQQGEAGSKDVTYDLIMINGNRDSQNVVEEKIIKQAKEKIVAQGTKVVVASRGDGGSGVLAWPVRGPIPPNGYFDSFRGSSRHGAIDIDAPTGTPIGAASDGTVIFLGWSGGYGNMIKIDHGNGLVTLYGHMSRFNVSSGARVSRGQIIGYVGSTGFSTGPHLHFEVIVNGTRRNPFGYLK